MARFRWSLNKMLGLIVAHATLYSRDALLSLVMALAYRNT